MTQEQFENTGFTAHMNAKIVNEGDVDYGKVFPIIEIDFIDNLIGLKMYDGQLSFTSWKRFENVEIVK